MKAKKSVFLRLTVLASLAALVTLAAGVSVSAQPAPPRRPRNATVFGPAAIHPGETLRVSGFNTTDRPIRYLVDIRNALTGELVDDGEAITPPKRGFTIIFGDELLAGTDSPAAAESPGLLVVIPIIGMFWDREGVSGPAPVTPVSTEIGMGCDPVCTRLLLPAIQAMSSGREGSSGEATAFVPATIHPGETLRINGFNTTDRPIRYIVDVRDALTGESFAERGEFIVGPKKGFTWLPEVEDELVVITIIGMFWDRAEIPTGRVTQTPVSAAIEMGCEPVCTRLLLPAVQSFANVDWGYNPGG